MAIASRVVCSAFAGAASASSAVLTSGFSYWSAIRSLAESSTRIVRYGSPVRSTERTASESMNIASSTSAIRNEASSSLDARDALPSCQYSQMISAALPRIVNTTSHCGHGCSKRSWGLVASPAAPGRHPVGRPVDGESRFVQIGHIPPISRRGIMVPESPCQERFHQQQGQQAIQQRLMKLAAPADRADILGQLLASWSDKESSSPGWPRPGPRDRAWSGRSRPGRGWRRTTIRARAAGRSAPDIAGQIGLLEVELADAARGLQLGRDRLALGSDHRDRGPGPGGGKRLVERLADADVPLGEPAGRRLA